MAKPPSSRKNLVVQCAWNMALAAMAFVLVMATGWSLWVIVALVVFNVLGYIEGGVKATLRG